MFQGTFSEHEFRAYHHHQRLTSVAPTSHNKREIRHLRWHGSPLISPSTTILRYTHLDTHRPHVLIHTLPPHCSSESPLPTIPNTTSNFVHFFTQSSSFCPLNYARTISIFLSESSFQHIRCLNDSRAISLRFRSFKDTPHILLSMQSSRSSCCCQIFCFHGPHVSLPYTNTLCTQACIYSTLQFHRGTPISEWYTCFELCGGPSNHNSLTTDCCHFGKILFQSKI